MKKFIPFFGLIVVLISVSSHANSQHPKVNFDANKQHKLSCEFDNVVFHSDYDTGRISACEQLGPAKFLISTLAENRPINPSPWYGFSIESSFENIQAIEVIVRAEKSRPRYLPKISQDKMSWTPLAFNVVNDDLVLSLEVGSDIPLQYVSGQEIIDVSYYSNWNRKIAQSSKFELETIGKSVEGRSIEALIHKRKSNKEWLLIIGRQHPPEITGALALVSFVEALIDDLETNQRLFERFNILLVPLVNPDGVAKGNWRHNTNGVDLNRDWGKFTQPETLAVHKKFGELMNEDHHLIFALDFHSTQQDIFYTIPTDYIPMVNKRQNIEKGVVPSLFAEQWLNDLKMNTVRSFTVRERPGSSPGRGVFKQFVADEYGVHAVTYEVGDNTDRTLIKHYAKESATTLVNRLLSTPKTEFLLEE